MCINCATSFHFADVTLLTPHSLLCCILQIRLSTIYRWKLRLFITVHFNKNFFQW